MPNEVDLLPQDKSQQDAHPDEQTTLAGLILDTDACLSEQRVGQRANTHAGTSNDSRTATATSASAGDLSP
jgi:hypothetical protein